MDRIYDGCMFKNADDTNKIIVAGGKCLITTSKFIWKDPCDVANHAVKTRSCTENEPTIHDQDFHDYMSKREWINQWIL